MKKGRQSRRPVVLLALGFALLTASVLLAFVSMVSQEQATRSVRHTLEVEVHIFNVGRLVTQAETGQRGYLITGDENYLAPYRRAVVQLPGVLSDLTAATADNPVQAKMLRQLEGLAKLRLSLLEQAIQLMMEGNGEAAINAVRSGRGARVQSELSLTIGRMVQEEERLLAYRTQLAERRAVLVRAILALSVIGAVLLAVIAVRGAKRRIDTLEAALDDLNVESEARDAAQGQVRQLQKMEAVGQLTGGIAHDFNNMLAIIVGSLDIARRRLMSGDREAVERSIDHALEGADRAAALTSQLLAFARRQPLEPRAIEPNKMVSSMSELLRRTLGESIQIETVLAGGLWRVHADPDQLESALLNLAVNGRDAMPNGGRLTIETANCELDERYAAEHDEVTPGQYVMISVTDTGTGMTPEVVAQAFEPFFTTKDVGRGTGLGLSQVFGFVKQSAGHVKIYSEPGEGTTVKLYLPRHAGEAAPVRRGRQDDMPLGRADELVLVVEDEPRVRRMSVDALIELGYGVIEATDGNEALALLADNPDIALLFTDIMMPGMSGRALADRALAQQPDLKVLYTTGYTRNAIVHNGVVDYGVAFIQKPFTIPALARKLREVLGED
ncbi:signal transduction histidine kinase [Sphingobium xanthum]|uniref:CHASE3 domain-containing protein n=1 Tax=Sphingobium xanthum TaxID=1387165 RepID=UPI001C8C0ACF|nr:CHASE3 domain-containing protein [Sphingobium xanthum]